MGALFNFQSGDFYYTGQSNFDWLSWLATVLGFIIAIGIYCKQRKDTENDAFKLFQLSLGILKGAVAGGLKDLDQFKEGMKHDNDNFVNPRLSANFNDKFLNKIEITALIRYYKKRKEDKLNILNEFLTKSSILGIYFDVFWREINYFREKFGQKEAIFQQHRFLIGNKFTEIECQNYEPRNQKFLEEYGKLRHEIRQRKDIINEDKLIINRTKLNECFIRPLIEISGRYICSDAKATDVCHMANEINAARVDIDEFKNAMFQYSKDSITAINEVNNLIIALHENKAK